MQGNVPTMPTVTPTEPGCILNCNTPTQAPGQNPSGSTPTQGAPTETAPPRQVDRANSTQKRDIAELCRIATEQLASTSSTVIIANAGGGRTALTRIPRDPAPLAGSDCESCSQAADKIKDQINRERSQKIVSNPNCSSAQLARTGCPMIQNVKSISVRARYTGNKGENPVWRCGSRPVAGASFRCGGSETNTVTSATTSITATTGDGIPKVGELGKLQVQYTFPSEAISSQTLNSVDWPMTGANQPPVGSQVFASANTTGYEFQAVLADGTVYRGIIDLPDPSVPLKWFYIANPGMPNQVPVPL